MLFLLYAGGQRKKEAIMTEDAYHGRRTRCNGGNLVERRGWGGRGGDRGLKKPMYTDLCVLTIFKSVRRLEHGYGFDYATIDDENSTALYQ